MASTPRAARIHQFWPIPIFIVSSLAVRAARQRRGPSGKRIPAGAHSISRGPARVRYEGWPPRLVPAVFLREELLMQEAPLRFGIFLAPFHPINENPALALERDFQLVEHLDRLGYDEAWIGEHHSAGFETIASPEVFIAAAGERTRRIRLGTGVSSLPYHHPFILADRVQQLDYQLKGRFMFGVGPGSLPSDAFMMGIDPLRQRDMMEEALDVLIPLLRGEAVTKITDWFSVKEARLQLMPYTRPHVEMAVAAQISPAGPCAAGKHGIGMLSIGSTTSRG